MKKTKLILIGTIFILNTCPYAQANGFGSVLNNNSGDKGDILIHSGDSRGKSNVGEWTDSSKFKGEKGNKGDRGKNGADGKEGKRGEKGETGKGLKDNYELQLEGVIKESRKTSTSIYFIRDLNNNHNTIGLKFKYYFGTSYSEQVRKDLQKQINELKNK